VKGAFSAPAGLRRAMNLWPPHLFAGIHVTEIAGDFRRVRVRLRRTPMVMRNLGPGYVVWDKTAEIEFIHLARTAVNATFHLDEAVLAELRTAADDGKEGAALVRHGHRHGRRHARRAHPQAAAHPPGPPAHGPQRVKSSVRRRRRTLPLAEIGSSSTTYTDFGHL
jgi:hypothetical protein